MNINDIAGMGSSFTKRKTAFGTNSFLSIGQKGQTVEGTVTKVSGEISINFNGVEVAVSKSAVQNAREGETRKFKIMDVSKDSIVLKEVGTSTGTGTDRVMAGTSVNKDAYTFAGVLEGSAAVSQAQHEAGQNLSVLTGEDYRTLEKEQGDLEEYKQSILDRAIEHGKEQKQSREQAQAAYKASQEAYQEDMDKMQAMGFLEQKNPQQIAQILEDADIPATQENIRRVTSAVQMAQTAGQISDQTRVYLIENELAPTIENLYHGQYSGSDAMDASAADDSAWEALMPQIQTVLEQAGLTEEADWQHAKWLFANDLPVTVQSLQTLDTLDRVQQQSTPQDVWQQILQAMATGVAPEQASLDTQQFVIARNVIQDFAAVTKQDILQAVRQAAGNDITLQMLKKVTDMTQSASALQSAPGDVQEQIPAGERDQIAAESRTVAAVQDPTSSAEGISGVDSGELIAERAVTAMRQLEEIRLKMTVQAAVRMQEKGIDIEVTGLSRIVEQLRQQERAYHVEIAGLQGTQVTEEQADLLEETLQKTADVRQAPAAVLGVGLRQQQLLTMNVLHRAATGLTRQYQHQLYTQDYEAVGTQVRSDLGDSIRKAFDGIPQMLEEMGLENTEANQRAVRILGYNRMEITEDSITLVKEQDARVQSVIDHMKPSVVLEMIRRGDNPLDMPLAQLEDKLVSLAKEKDITQEEKYSRYLWQLERDQAISEQERDGYIGIYRLLNNIENSDGAAVGAVLETKREMTLGNLLTAVRTARQKGIDTKVDDGFGGLTQLVFQGKSIVQQIEHGFAGQDADPAVTYYQRIAEDTLDQMTPEGVRVVSDGDLEQILHTSLEAFHEQMQSVEGQSEQEAAYYENAAEQMRETAEYEEAAQYLEQLAIPDTISNVAAAEQLIGQGRDVIKEVYGRKELLSSEEQRESEELLSELPDALDAPEQLQQRLQQVSEYMDRIIDRAYQQTDLSYGQAEQLKLWRRGIRLQGSMAHAQDYQIPVRTGDTITSLRVTFTQGQGDSGKVQIAIPDMGQDIGDISIELRMSGKELKGLVLCDNRQGAEFLEEGKDTLTRQLAGQEIEVKNLSYAVDVKHPYELTGNGGTQTVTTQKLYQAAKAVVCHTIEWMQRKGDAYEN